MGENEVKQGYAFGTFKGVYTPSVLTIFGVVMYLRFGWVLGNVGLWGTLLIVTLATSITFLTGLSISAMATNMKVGGGGAYYIIARSLGLEAGAAIVSTDCPFGPREILDGERFGRLVPVGDALLAAAALEAEIESSDVGPDVRRAERAQWMRQFDPEVITGRYLELIRDVIAEAEA